MTTAPELPEGFGIEPLTEADLAPEGEPGHDCTGDTHE